MAINYGSQPGNPKIQEIIWTWTADGAGAVASETISYPVTGAIVAAVFNPGSTAPTDNYDITLTDADNTDVLLGAGQDLDTSTSERRVPTYTSVPVPSYVANATLTFNLSGNSVASATGTARVLIDTTRS